MSIFRRMSFPSKKENVKTGIWQKRRGENLKFILVTRKSLALVCTNVLKYHSCVCCYICCCCCWWWCWYCCLVDISIKNAVVFDSGWCKSYGFLIFHPDPFHPRLTMFTQWFGRFFCFVSLFFLLLAFYFLFLLAWFCRAISHRITIHLSSGRIICNILLIFVFYPALAHTHTHSRSRSCSRSPLKTVLTVHVSPKVMGSWNSVRWTDDGDDEKNNKIQYGPLHSVEAFSERRIHKCVLNVR